MELTADNILKVIKSSGATVEPFWPGLFAAALDGCDVATLITNIGSGVGAAPAAGGAAAAGGEAAAEAKAESVKEESEEESDSDMGFDLFG